MAKQESQESQYVKVVRATKTGKTVITYRDRVKNKFVKEDSVPEAVKTSLDNFEPGVVVDKEGVQVSTVADAELDPQAAKKAEAVAKAQPDSPEALDEAKADYSRPKAQKPGKVTHPEGEAPGGPQEPQEATLAPLVDPAADVADDGTDVLEQDRIARAIAGQDQDEEGMGFKRVNGKTVDIFDGKTPHTQVRYVANVMVPLSDENYKTKSDGEIVDQLRKLGKIA